MNIKEIVKSQKAYFETGKTLDYENRLESLQKLKKILINHEDELADALQKDLNKSKEEVFMTEIGFTLTELSYMEKRLKKFMKTKKVKTPLAQFHSSSFVVPEPYGNTLIMSPWNYPITLSFGPMIGAIAAGNTVILKPSNYSFNISMVMKKLINQFFDENYIAVVTGGREENNELLDEKFDYIFFTGSPIVGRIVMEKAAKNLTPVCLELGGKSPCIIDKGTNVDLAAKRIAFGKSINSGQTCVAPDYLFVHEYDKHKFIDSYKKYIKEFYGENPLEYDKMVHIINQKHYDRLKSLFENENIIFGGACDDQKLLIEPTLIDNIDGNSLIMQEEIFGPILPILTYKDIDDVIKFVNSREKPLALYFFSENKNNEDKMLRQCSFGGGCINDTIIHIASDSMPFGGVGNSGMGTYHGKASFDIFTHYKSILKKYNWIDLPMRYLPYNEKKSKLIRFFLK